MTREELLEIGFTNKQLDKAYKTYCDLSVQAMMFDMNIDIERMTLIRKNDPVLSTIERANELLEQSTEPIPNTHWLRKQTNIDFYKQPLWITRYREKLEQSDYTPDGSDDQEYDGDGDERYLLRKLR